MTKPRELDCGCWNAPDDFNRIVVRQRPDGLYDIVHVRYVRTREGMHKTESPCGVYRDLKAAKDAGWAIWRELRGVGA